MWKLRRNLPLRSPNCGREKRITAFTERREQTDFVARIAKHRTFDWDASPDLLCGVWRVTLCLT